MVDDAIYKRNRMIEEKYNLNIKETGISSGNIVNTISNSVKAGSDDYDIALPHSYDIGTLAQRGMLYDFNSLPYIDFEKSWWGNSIKDFSISGKVYFAISDFLLSDKETCQFLCTTKKSHR